MDIICKDEVNLPLELIEEIFLKLDVKSLLSINLVNKHFNNIIEKITNRYIKIWYNYYQDKIDEIKKSLTPVQLLLLLNNIKIINITDTYEICKNINITIFPTDTIRYICLKSLELSNLTIEPLMAVTFEFTNEIYDFTIYDQDIYDKSANSPVEIEGAQIIKTFNIDDRIKDIYLESVLLLKILREIHIESI